MVIWRSRPYGSMRGRFRTGEESRPITGQAFPRFLTRALLGLALLVLVNAPADASTVAAGRDHSAIVLPDGSVWVWGSNARGQLGIDAADASPVPVPVLGPAEVVALSSGEAHLLALTRNGDVWAWGANDSGQVGDGSEVDRREPVLVLRGVVGIAAGRAYSIAWTTDGGDYDGTASASTPVCSTKLATSLGSVSTFSPNSRFSRSDPPTCPNSPSTLMPWG